jgi:hypothetical protein
MCLAPKYDDNLKSRVTLGFNQKSIQKVMPAHPT